MSKSDDIRPGRVTLYLLLTRLDGETEWRVLSSSTDEAKQWRRLRAVAAAVPNADYDIVTADELDWVRLV